MKKVLKILLSLILIAGAIGSVIFTLNSRRTPDENIETYKSQIITEYVDGKKSTKRVTEWTQDVSNEYIKYTKNINMGKQITCLWLGDNKYIDLWIPYVDYEYSLGKTILAKDGSFSISVYSGISMDSMAEQAGLVKYDTVGQSTIISQKKVKGMRTIATLVGDSLIVANVYKNNEVYSILLDSLQSLGKPYIIEEPVYGQEYFELTNVDTGSTFVPSVTLSQNKVFEEFLFEEGSLSVFQIFQPVENVTDIYTVLLNRLAEEPLRDFHTELGSTIYFAGDYSLGIKPVNANSTEVYLGYGEEALVNMYNLIYSD